MSFYKGRQDKYGTAVQQGEVQCPAMTCLSPENNVRQARYLDESGTAIQGKVQGTETTRGKIFRAAWVIKPKPLLGNVTRG